MGTPLRLSATEIKGCKFCDFLFASLDNVVLLKWILPSKETIYMYVQCSKILPLKVAVVEMGSKIIE